MSAQIASNDYAVTRKYCLWPSPSIFNVLYSCRNFRILWWEKLDYRRQNNM